MDKEIQLSFTVSIVNCMAPMLVGEAEELPAFITSVYDALGKCGEPAVVEQERPEPAVSIRASVKPDYLVCLEDGKQMTMLKRYLMTNYNLTPEQYRTRWGLSADYPMVAPNYREKRARIAKENGLGRKPGKRTRA